MTLDDLVKLINVMCEADNAKLFVPLLEADVVGYLYYLILSSEQSSLAEIHLDSRVTGSGNQKVDLALGPVMDEKGKRPAVAPSALVEIKVFPMGFTDAQHRVHFEHVLNDDLPKLSKLRCPLKIQLLFDTGNYLSGSYDRRPRIDAVIQKRNELDASIKLVITKRQDGTLKARII